MLEDTRQFQQPVYETEKTIQNRLKYERNQPTIIEIPKYNPQQIEDKIISKMVFLTGIRQLCDYHNQLKMGGFVCRTFAVFE